ncbi:tRNA pseudouridine(38-40) synthase TruA [Halalkalibacillus halophilus]|uniref:tRNA pseudouridine(38-40) synthase TruA n=1 Tax=Halalkalibacillus halophilus TaxID=392827 RepID=UPI000422443E|nr:tRNA pseudouridine(38-40) synthase TruA [Halalkalibacillus halophilus]
MKRIRLDIAYDGTNFAGYQVQPGKRTVQSKLEHALEKIHKYPVGVHASGRTDSNVHANQQVVHFDTALEIEAWQWIRAIQTLVPDDMLIKEVLFVDKAFDARKDAKEKEYKYQVLNQEQFDVFTRHLEWHVKGNLDVQAMQEAAKLIEGTHDFTAFAASKSNVKGNKTRTIRHCKVKQDGNRIIFSVQGNGFLTYMVRIIVGTLIEIGRGRKTQHHILKAFETNNRNHLGMTAPGHGLRLERVIY